MDGYLVKYQGFTVAQSVQNSSQVQLGCKINGVETGCGAMSARAKLARLVLQMLACGDPVPAHDAFQLRNWAETPEDAMLTLEELALRILIEEYRNPRSA
jgi:hypothetical protein